ncbi:type VII secretion integral membrane protein EccD [Nocardia mangyaensis]|uniref:Type VII secretion integral membrane protein EccD n=1 Tax=Nocardia mangyaensis TaxID=2213200 RepID=A0A1J0W1D5_9NOCA|nr:type VII secretion integral membrane protein EccD [Nocardia mangyaensis]APE38009.1 type VII secretion integral membrane protein EccD [Nocardia mangyaensis]
MCRVSVIGGNTQLDVGLPASVPIAAFITDLVALIGSRDPATEDAEGGAVPDPQRWTLARIGAEAIAPNRSLLDAEVHDGDLLVLRSVAAKEAPALFDDVIDAVSRLTAAEFRSWSPASARWVGLLGAGLATVLTLILLAAGRSHGDGLAAPLLLLGYAAGAAAAATIAARRFQDETTAVWLSLCGLLLVFGGGILLVPGPFGSPHLLLGFSLSIAAAVGLYRSTASGALLCAATVTLGVLGGGGAAVQFIWQPGLPKIAAGLLVVALIVISLAPRFAAVAARLPIPPVPTAGAAIDPADHEPRPTIEGVGAVGATTLPSAVGLGRRARAANRYQSGIMIGCTVAVAGGALGAADPFGAARWQGVALAVVAAIILCLRGRAFADLTQAATLISGGAATFLALVIAMAAAEPDRILTAAVLLLVFAAAVVAFGVIGPHTEITPVARRAVEIFEYLLIVTVVPLVLWLLDVYSMARNL